MSLNEPARFPSRAEAEIRPALFYAERILADFARDMMEGRTGC